MQESATEKSRFRSRCRALGVIHSLLVFRNRLFFRRVLAAGATVPRAVQYQFRMFSAEGLRDVAIPANGQMSFENLGQFFRWNFVPLFGRPVGRKQRWMAIVPVHYCERLLAIRARLSVVPLAHDTPDETATRISFDLGQAVLPAILPFGPSRALMQSNLIVADRRSFCRIHGIDVHRGRLKRLGTSHQALAPIAAVGVDRHRKPEDNRADDQGENCGKDEVCRDHKPPLRPHAPRPASLVKRECTARSKAATFYFFAGDD